jgi:hypothetical protein
MLQSRKPENAGKIAARLATQAVIKPLLPHPKLDLRWLRRFELLDFGATAPLAAG